jgi:hypothetical protein
MGLLGRGPGGFGGSDELIDGSCGALVVAYGL